MPDSVAGALLALLAAFCFACSNVFVAKSPVGASDSRGVLVSIVFTLVISAAAWLAFEAGTTGSATDGSRLTGIYVLEGQPADVILYVVMGLLGYLMIRFDYPRLTLVIALVLGETAERSYHQTLMISDYQMWSFIMGRPIAVVLVAGIVLTLLLPILRKRAFGRARREAANVPAKEPRS